MLQINNLMVFFENALALNDFTMRVRENELVGVIGSNSAGKTTLTRRLLQEFPELRFSVSHTTREPRANEVAGQDYHFVSEEAFRAIIADKGFAEWAEVHGNLYGTCVSEIDIARAAA